MWGSHDAPYVKLAASQATSSLATNTAVSAQPLSSNTFAAPVT